MLGRSKSCLKVTPYVSEDAVRGLKNYKYAGADLGIAYELFFNPVCNYIVNHWMPETWAPNTLTTIGFLFTVVPYIMAFYLFGTTFSTNEEPIPSWFYYFWAVSYFMYRMFDEIDGK
jgi:ethanolaminephosphotransferase